jgi:lipoprotein-releasing system ATP-binding protein
VRGVAPKQAKQKAQQVLEEVGLEARLYHKVYTLSGGERQRTAIARALVSEPACVLADEPTGNLDKQTAEQVYATMLRLNRAKQTSLIVATHDRDLAAQMDRVLYIESGRIG